MAVDDLRAGYCEEDNKVFLVLADHTYHLEELEVEVLIEQLIEASGNVVEDGPEPVN